MQPREPFLKGTLYLKVFLLTPLKTEWAVGGRLATMRGFFFLGEIFDAGTSTKFPPKKAYRNAVRSNEARQPPTLRQ